jgi:hypothetical protein
MIFLINIKHYLHDKSPEESGMEGMYFNIIKGIYDKPIANII